MAKMSPMIEQYLQIKETCKECILLFRLGDFYEMFFEDAEIASKVLELVLTGRDCGTGQRAPMCGVPYHSVNNYIKKLIDNGYKVAICEQTSDPAQSKGLVEREIVRIITPGTVIEENMVERERNQYIACLFYKNETYGISWCDVSTGEFLVDTLQAENAATAIRDLYVRIQPAELLISEQMNREEYEALKGMGVNASTVGDWAFRTDTAFKLLCEHFRVQTLSGYGLDDAASYVNAAGGLLYYLKQTQKVELAHINSILHPGKTSVMDLDPSTKRNLELTQSIFGSNKRGTLLGTLNHTKTAQGARLLRKWVEQPLRSVGEIQSRLDAVENFVEDISVRESIALSLSKCYDIQRVCSKLSYQTLNGRDARAIERTLRQLPQIYQSLQNAKSERLRSIAHELPDLSVLCQSIDSKLVETPPVSVRDGGLIREGFNEEIDQCRRATKEGKQWLLDLEAKEKEATGIKTLKIGFNKVFGFYIEVSRGQAYQVPYRYVRKQTLVNAERFITDELKNMEETILGADEKCKQLEYRAFIELRDEIATYMVELQKAATLLAELDALQSMAVAAYEYGYVRPSINESSVIDIQDGRHPVVEQTVRGFVPNSTYLDSAENRFHIITGPNMSGKSTYMRQTALIVLMAQIGSFVPAAKANICCVNRIFTRVGASDDLASGRSTFMVEMVELANILNNATGESLIILDEIGRGTSTYDGLSIAWAASEYICEKLAGAKTLFATHYHELSELEGKNSCVKNYSVSAIETNDDVVFLHRVVRGGTDKSFGVQVASLAGVPNEVVERAKAVLSGLEKEGLTLITEPSRIRKEKENTVSPETVDFLTMVSKLDISRLTPLEALNLVNELQQRAERLL